MSTEHFDTNGGDGFNNKVFISEVEKRPAIWDTTLRIYSDKQLKKDCWDQLVDIFINKEKPSEDERIEYCRTLQRKWKSARDCFNRECQRLQKAKQGLATSRKSPYTYYKNLSFLHKIMKKNTSTEETKKTEPSSQDTSNSLDDSVISITDTSLTTTDTSTSSVSNTEAFSTDCTADTSSLSVNDIYLIEEGPGYNSERSPKRRKMDLDLDDESELTRMLQPTIQLVEGEAQTTESTPKSQEEDSDRLFLLSLHEPLKQVPKRLRMSVRVKIMQVVDSAMKWRRAVDQD